MQSLEIYGEIVTDGYTLIIGRNIDHYKYLLEIYKTLHGSYNIIDEDETNFNFKVRHLN